MTPDDSPAIAPARLLLSIAAAASALAIPLLALRVAPPAQGFVAPLSYRLLYVHVPTAWAAYLAFLVTFVGSLLHLHQRRQSDQAGLGADRVAAASAEVGTLFATIALGTGLLWARVEFLAYDPFTDPKVVTLVVLLLAYVGYLALRGTVEDRRDRARLASGYGLAAFLAVPMSYLASRVSLHPDFTTPEQSLAPALRWVLLASTLAATILYAHLTLHRATNLAVQDEIRDVRGVVP